MSSTNRSNARAEHIADYYITPIEKIHEFLNRFLKIETLEKDLKILDCCAGGDSENMMSYPTALKEQGFKNVDTIDIREDSLAKVKGNYLEIDCENKYDVIITNPPFNVSKDIIQKALKDVKEGGFVIMLLRLNYFGGKVREDLWKSNMPKYCFVHNKRMSFLKNGKTDSIEYCHMVWQKGYEKDNTQLRVLMAEGEIV